MVTFKKISDNAIMPEPTGKNQFRLHTSRIIRIEIIDDETHYYLGTGVVAIQSITHQLYIHPLRCLNAPLSGMDTRTKEFLSAFRLVDTIGIILPEDNTEIIVHVKKIRPYTGRVETLHQIPIAGLSCPPKEEKLYIPLVKYSGYEKGIVKQFILINGNIPHINSLIHATSPIPDDGLYDEYQQIENANHLFNELDMQKESRFYTCDAYEGIMRPISYKWFAHDKRLKELGVDLYKKEYSELDNIHHSQREIAEIIQYALKTHGIPYFFQKKQKNDKPQDKNPANQPSNQPSNQPANQPSKQVSKQQEPQQGWWTYIFGDLIN